MRNVTTISRLALPTRFCLVLSLRLRKPVRFYGQLMMCLILCLQPLNNSYAMSLTYSGDASLLQNTPMWIGYPKSQVLFPGLALEPSSSGNDLTIDFTVGIAPGGVLGGLSKDKNSENNTVNVHNGRIEGVIIGGYVDEGTGSANNNSVVVGENGIVNGSISGGVVDTGTGTAHNNTLTIKEGATIKNGITGGESSDGEAFGNTVNVEGAALGQSVWGGTSDNGAVSQNKISIADSSVFAEVYGGSSNTGAVSKNKVQISNSTISSDHNIGVHGGLAIKGNSIENSVYLSGTTTAKYVYGGKSIEGSALGNTVVMNDTVAVTSLSGGAVLAGSGDAKGNFVTMTGGTVTENLSGGRVGKLSDDVIVPTGNAIANKLNISGGTVMSAAFGGQSSLGYAKDNQVNISGTAQLQSNLFGGYSQGGYVASNTVTIQGGEVSASVYGGRSDNGYAQGNAVIFEGGKAAGIFGAYAPKGHATDNSVTIKGGTITGFVYGARSDTSSASNNSVAMTGGTAGSVFGAYSNTGKVDNNSVDITSGSITSDIYGGFTAAGSTANNNSVKIGSTATAGSSAGNLVYGGYNAGGAANNNTVIVDGGKVLGATYGAYGSTQANRNIVNIIGGQVRSIVGGFSSNGEANNNSVSIKDATAVGNIFGGFAHSQKDAINNTISISGNSNLAGATLIGGYQGAGTGNVFSGNTLNIDGFKGSIQGFLNFENINFILSAPLQSGETVLNVLTNAMPTNISNSNIGVFFSDNPLALRVGTSATLIDATSGVLLGSIHDTRTSGTSGAKGLWTYTLSTINNKLDLFLNKLEISTLEAGAAYAVVAGNGLDRWAALKVNNSFKVKDFTMSSNNDNTASLAVGGVMAVENFTATKNNASISVNVNTLDVTKQNTTLTLEGTAPWNGSTGILFGTIALGGEKTLTLAGTGDFDFKELEVHGKNTIWDGDLNGNGKQFSFFLTPNISKNDTLLTVTGTTGSSITGCNISTHLSGGAPILGPGDRIQFIDVQGSTLSGAPNSLTGSHGVSLLYDFAFSQDEHDLYGTVSRVMLNPQTKALSEGRVLGLAFLNQGSTLLAEEGMRSLKNAARPSARSNVENRIVTFATTGVHQVRFNTGSHIDSKGVSFVAGIAWDIPLPVNSLLLGTFYETGKGNYTSYNTFSNAANVKGDGDTEYYGGGILGRYYVLEGPLTNLYTELSLRAGYSITNFFSTDLRDAAEQNASYDSAAPYYGAHLGLGYDWQLNENSRLDFSTKYLFTHQEGDSVTVTGDPIKFKASKSQRWRNGIRLNYDIGKHFSPYIGAAWEYEFDGKAKATVYGHDIESPSLQGGTIIVELGADFYTAEDSNFSLNLGIQSYTGKYEGVGGNLSFKYEF